MSTEPELDPFWALLSTRGEMGRRIGSFPWHQTPLGPPDKWPHSLRCALSICLNSRSPIGIFWTRDCYFFYNDAVCVLIGDRHPEALGRPAAEAFPDIWESLREHVESVFAGGEAIVTPDPMFCWQDGRSDEERYFKCAWSPISRTDGSVGGIFKIAFDTTERILAERELRASEARYRAFLTATSNSIYRISADGRKILEASGTLLQPHETQTPTSMAPFQDCIHPDDRDEAYRGWMEAVKAERCYHKEVRGRRPDGTLGWMLTCAAPVRDDNGRVIEWLGSATDITDRKRAEAALMRSEARLKAAIDLVGLAPYTWDMETGALDWHVRIKAMWGLPPDAPVTFDLAMSAVHPEDRGRVENAIALATDPRGNGVFSSEYRIIGIDDGIERWVAAYGQTTFRNGRPVSITGAALDITERRSAEERLRRSEAHLAAILEQLPVAVGLYDTEGRLTISNSMIRGFVGEVMPSRDPQSSRYWRAYGPDGKILERSQYPSARALRGETVSPGIDFVRTYDDGRELWTRVSSAPFCNGNGKIAGAIVVVQDIDDEKLAQDANLVLIAELQHRTRNLLAVVRSIANQVMKGSTSREDFAARLSDRLGALSRVQGLLSRPPGSSVSMGDLIRIELAAIGRDEKDRQITLRGSEVTLPIDVVQTLALALHELATNALKYGALSASEGKIDISWQVFSDERGERRLMLTWLESGVPIKPPAKDPARRGFGRELIERALPYQFHARTKLEITERGVSCVIDLPLTDGEES